MENKPTAGGINRHMLLMVLCCAVPLALIAGVAILRIEVGSIGTWAVLLLCPLLHLVLMRGMHNHRGEQACHTTSADPTSQQSEPVALPTAHERAKVPATLEQ